MDTKSTISGNLNPNIYGLRKSATLAINEKCHQLVSEGRQVFKLGFGQSPFPVPEPVVEELKKHAHQKDYLPVKGLCRLRQTMAAYWKCTQNLDYTAEDILVSPGSKELLFLIQMVYDGDLIIPSPSWVSYAPQAAIAGRKIRWAETRPGEKWLLNSETLENICAQNPGRPQVLILNYPSNPTGSTFSEEELKALGATARKYGVLIVSDEIYGDLHHDDNHISIARFYPEGTIISSGLSKWCGAGGWRLGMFTFPPELRRLLEAMAVVASETYTSASTPVQFASVAAYREHPVIETQLKHSRKILKIVGHYLHKRLKGLGVHAPPPEGGFYLFPDFDNYKSELRARKIQNSTYFCEKLLSDTGVALLPGIDFGRPGDQFVTRLSYVDFDGAEALAGWAKHSSNLPNDDFIERYCPNIIGAMDEIEGWLKQGN